MSQLPRSSLASFDGPSRSRSGSGTTAAGAPRLSLAGSPTRAQQPFHFDSSGSDKASDSDGMEEWPSEAMIMRRDSFAEASTSPFSLPSAIVEAYMGSTTSPRAVMEPEEEIVEHVIPPRSPRGPNGLANEFRASTPERQRSATGSTPRDSTTPVLSRTQSASSGFGYVQSAMQEVRTRNDSFDSQHALGQPSNISSSPRMSFSMSSPESRKNSLTSHAASLPERSASSTGVSTYATTAEPAPPASASAMASASATTHPTPNPPISAPKSPLRSAGPPPAIREKSARRRSVALQQGSANVPDQSMAPRASLDVPVPAPESSVQRLSPAPSFSSLDRVPQLEVLEVPPSDSFASAFSHFGLEDSGSDFCDPFGSSTPSGETNANDAELSPKRLAEPVEIAQTRTSTDSSAVSAAPAARDRAAAKARAAAFVADLKRAKANAQKDAGVETLATGPENDTTPVQLQPTSQDPARPTLTVPAVASLRAESTKAESDGGYESDAPSVPSKDGHYVAMPPPDKTPDVAPTFARQGSSQSAGVPVMTRRRSSQIDPFDATPSRSTHPRHLSTATVTPQLHSQAALLPARSRQLPHYVSLVEIRRCRTPGERARVYASKYGDLMRDQSALHVWLLTLRSQAHGSAEPVMRYRRRESREQASGGSAITFPARGDGGRAREIPTGGSFDPARDMVPNVPYPGGLHAPAQRSVSSLSMNRPTSLLTGKTGGFFSLGRRTSRKVEQQGGSGHASTKSIAGYTITSPFSHMTIGVSVPHLNASSLANASFAQQSPSQPAYAPQTSSNYGRTLESYGRSSMDSTAAGAPIYASRSLAFDSASSSGGPSSSYNESLLGSPPSIGQAPSLAHQPMSVAEVEALPDFEDKMQQLVDVLPHESRSTLLDWLRRARGDENAAISMYLADESNAYSPRMS